MRNFAHPIAAVLLLAWPAAAAETSPVVISPVLDATTTVSGQPIKLQGATSEVVVTRYAIMPGAELPVHKHPFPRYGYVLSGTLSPHERRDGCDTEVFAPGAFIVEAVGQWHRPGTRGRKRSSCW